MLSGRLRMDVFAEKRGFWRSLIHVTYPFGGARFAREKWHATYVKEIAVGGFGYVVRGSVSNHNNEESRARELLAEM